MVDGTSEQIRIIKRELRLAMNGVASTLMRESGFDYKVNFGVELPRLQAIAAEQPHEFRLSLDLWNEPVRESKILAAMLMPTDEFTRDFANVWVEQIPNIEIARTTVMYLFSRLPYSVDLAFSWIATDHEMRQVCGFLIMARLLILGVQLNESLLAELRDQAQAVMSSSRQVAQAARAVLARL